jgi:hypothetical protein
MSGGVYDIDLDTGVSTLRTSASATMTANAFASSFVSGQSVLHTTGTLWEIDVCDGTITELGATKVPNTCGLAYGADGVLYGVDSIDDALVVYDATTGAGTSYGTGSLGWDLKNCGLAYDCATDRLFGLNINSSKGTGTIFEVDPSTGVGTDVVTLDTAVKWSTAGIEVEPLTGDYIVSTASGVYLVDPLTGLATKASSFPASNLTYSNVTCGP